MSEWHDHEELWADFGPVMFTDQRVKDAEAEVDRLIQLAALSAGMTVLDAGCGVGRHSIPLARRGLIVTGMDRTAQYLDKARRRAEQEKQSVEWIQADMREFRRPGEFDVIVNLLTSFGYFSDPADDRRVFEHWLESLKTGGRLVLDIMGKEVLARIFRPFDWHEEPDGTILLEARTVAEDWTRLDLRWIVLRDSTRHEHRFSLRLYSASDLKASLRNVGFADVRVFGSLDGTPYNHEAQRLVVVAEKS